MAFPDPRHVTATLADAFIDDPVMCWIFEDDELRPEQLKAFWGFNVRQNPPTGRILATPGYEAAAIWRAPVVSEPAGEGQSAFVTLLVGLLGEQVTYAKLAELAAVSEAHPHSPHWYLPAVGTRGDAQGQGFGPLVINPILEVCDASEIPAFLESSNPRNVGFYERMGFETTGRLEIANDGPVFTFMWREPRS